MEKCSILNEIIHQNNLYNNPYIYLFLKYFIENRNKIKIML